MTSNLAKKKKKKGQASRFLKTWGGHFANSPDPPSLNRIGGRSDTSYSGSSDNEHNTRILIRRGDTKGASQHIIVEFGNRSYKDSRRHGGLLWKCMIRRTGSKWISSRIG